MATAVTVLRRLGFVLLQALEACERSLCDKGLTETASMLRDEVKPLCDALIHFELEDADGTVSTDEE